MCSIFHLLGHFTDHVAICEKTIMPLPAVHRWKPWRWCVQTDPGYVRSSTTEGTISHSGMHALIRAISGWLRTKLCYIQCNGDNSLPINHTHKHMWCSTNLLFRVERDNAINFILHICFSCAEQKRIINYGFDLDYNKICIFNFVFPRTCFIDLYVIIKLFKNHSSGEHILFTSAWLTKKSIWALHQNALIWSTRMHKKCFAVAVPANTLLEKRLHIGMWHHYDDYSYSLYLWGLKAGWLAGFMVFLCIVCTILFNLYFGKYAVTFIDIGEIGCMSIP